MCLSLAAQISKCLVAFVVKNSDSSHEFQEQVKINKILRNLTLRQYSEISGRLKHPFSLTPIDRYSLGKLMVKISVAMILRWRDMQNNMNCTSPLKYCTVISMPGHRNSKNPQICLFCQNRPVSAEVLLKRGQHRRVLSEYTIKSVRVKKSVLRIRGSLNIPLNVQENYQCSVQNQNQGRSQQT